MAFASTGAAQHQRVARAQGNGVGSLAAQMACVDLRALAVIIKSLRQAKHLNPLCHRLGVVQSNEVYLPQEVLLVSTGLAWRQINAIR